MKKMEVLQLKVMQTEPTDNQLVDNVKPLQPRLYSISYRFELPFGKTLQGSIVAPVTPKMERVLTELATSIIAQMGVVVLWFMCAALGAYACVGSVKMIVDLIKMFYNG